jgi:two-component system, NarL family, nitrate/nitrite response regulator NarL
VTGDPGPSLLIADHAPTRTGIRMAVEDVISSCAEAGDADSAITLAETLQPDVVIVGSELTGGGIAAVEGILAVARNARIVLVTPSLEADDLLSAMKAGAVGYLPGSIDPVALRRVVRAVAAGEAAIPRSMVVALARELRVNAGGGDGLTTREAQVLALLRRGDSTSAIAEQLSISPITVRRHISTLMHKAGVDNREALADADMRLPSPPSADWREPVGASS